MSRNRRRGGAVRLLRGVGAGIAQIFEPLRRVVRPLLVGGASLALVGFAAASMWKIALESPYFRVRVVEADETAHLDRARLLALTGLDAATNIFCFDAEAAAEALRSEPWVAEARVEIRLPSAVEIEVRERVPVAVLWLDGLYLVDGTGLPFVRAGAIDAASLPLIDGLARAAYEADPEAAAAKLRDALALLRHYRASALVGRPGAALSNVRIGAAGRLDLILGQTRVSLGRRRYEPKLERLAAIFRVLDERGMDAEYVLLDTLGERAVVREVPRPEAPGPLGVRGAM